MGPDGLGDPGGDRGSGFGRVAIVHDWLVGWGGSERVVQVLAEIFPAAPIFTAVWSPDPKVEAVFGSRDVRTTSLQKLPGSGRHYPRLLPLMPGAFRRLDLSGFDLVVSSSHAFSKAVRVPDGPHVNYCHSPPRYLWDLYWTYNPGWRGVVGGPLAWMLRRSDRRAARGVDRFVANSRTVAGRISRHYGKEAAVIHPPVDVDRFVKAGRGAEPEEWFLAGGRMVRYKRLDVLVEAANRGGFPLKVFGDGPDRRSLEAQAGSNVEFLGHLDDEELTGLLPRCRAFLFAAEEDFGILPVEVQAAGRPVVAWGRGGATETVVHGKTGLLLKECTPEAFARGAEESASRAWDSDDLRTNAYRFTTERFRDTIIRELEAVVKQAGP